VVAALRGHRDMAIGNVLGSNIFNLTAILGTTAVAADGLSVSPGVLSFDLIVMVAVAVACLPIFFTGHQVSRWEGGLFLAYYVAYTAYLVLDATDHERLPHFRDGLLFFALPLTAVTLIVLSARAAVARGRQQS
jgi:cation:H+ antiporter